MILLDTNVLSEALKPAPAQNVVTWLNQCFHECALSSVTVFELKAGVAMLDPGRRRDTIENAVTRLVRRFATRIYPFDAAAAEEAARLLAIARAGDMALHQVPAKLADLQIAGIAAAYGLELATRNTGDFAGLGIDLIDPWAP